MVRGNSKALGLVISRERCLIGASQLQWSTVHAGRLLTPQFLRPMSRDTELSGLTSTSAYTTWSHPIFLPQHGPACPTMRGTPDEPQVVSVLLLREPVSVSQGTDAYHDAFGSFGLASYSLSALESGSSTPRNANGQIAYTPDGERSRSPVSDRTLTLNHNIFQDRSYLMTHHLSSDDDSREYWIVSYPILSHKLENIQALADRILHAVENKVSYDGVIITSKRAVQAWVEACKRVASIMQERPDSKMDSERIWSTVPYYVVGPATAKALTSARLAPMLQPREVIGASDTGTGTALAQCMAQRFAAQNVSQPQRLLYLVGSKHSLSLQETLEELKAPVELDELCVYSTEKDTNFEYHCRLLSKELPRVDAMQSLHKSSPLLGRHHNLMLTELDTDGDTSSPMESPNMGTPLSQGQAPKWIVFFSPSGGDYALSDLEAYNWVRKGEAGSEKSMPKIACIGSTTATWVRERLGVEPDAIAERPTPDSLRDAIVNSERAD